jgi:hypothetical protein
MLDKFLYSFFGIIDTMFSKLETCAIKVTEWCWHSRVNLLHKRRKKNVERRTSNIK